MGYIIIFLACIGLLSALFVLAFYKWIENKKSVKKFETKAMQNNTTITFEEHNI